MIIAYVVLIQIAISFAFLTHLYAKTAASKFKKEDLGSSRMRVRIRKYRRWFFGMDNPSDIPIYVAVLWYIAIAEVLFAPIICWLYSVGGMDTVYVCFTFTYAPMGLYSLFVSKI